VDPPSGVWLIHRARVDPSDFATTLDRRAATPLPDCTSRYRVPARQAGRRIRFRTWVEYTATSHRGEANAAPRPRSQAGSGVLPFCGGRYRSLDLSGTCSPRTWSNGPRTRSSFFSRPALPAGGGPADEADLATVRCCPVDEMAVTMISSGRVPTWFASTLSAVPTRYCDNGTAPLVGARVGT
jgi:hypothetical protein